MLALLLVFAVLGGVALAVLAFTASSPLKSNRRLALGLALIAFNRPLAESGVLVVIGAAGTPGAGEVPHEPSQPRWYSPGRLLALAVGLILAISGALLLAGSGDFIEDFIESL